MNRSTGEIRHFRHDPQRSGSLLSNHVSALYEDRQGVLWVGLWAGRGFQRFDPTTGTARHFPGVSSDTSVANPPQVNAIAEAEGGAIWVGGSGISRYNPTGNTFRHYATGTGMAGNRVMSITRDEEGVLWIGTRDGLCRLIPETGVMTRFTTRDGLPGNRFTKGHALLGSGEIALGTTSGIVVFHPDSLHAKGRPTIPVLSNLRVFDSLRVADLCDTTHISLLWSENFFSLEFAAPAELQPEGVSYLYRLEPLEKAWRGAGSENRKAAYTSLPPGVYTFKVAIAPLSGVEPDGIRSLIIEITPPFWKTWWFYMLVAAMAVATLVGLFLLRDHQLTLRNRTLEMKQRLLRSQMNPHFIFNALFAIQNYIYEERSLSAGKYLAAFASLIRIRQKGLTLPIKPLPMDHPLRTLIVDDEPNARNAIRKMAELFCPDVRIVSEATDVNSALEAIQRYDPDLVLLDVEMPDGTGFDLLRQIPNIDFHVIFITAHEHYALQAIKFSALDYILKPVNPDDLIAAVAKAISSHSDDLLLKLKSYHENSADNGTRPTKIVLNTANNIYVLHVDEIIRCEADENYTTLYSLHREKITVSKTLKEFEAMLTPMGFFRTHQSHLINLAFVESYQKGTGGAVVLKNREKIPVSARRKEVFLKLLSR